MNKLLTREECLSVFKHATYPDWVTRYPSILKAQLDALYERVRVLEEQAPMDAYEKLDAAEAALKKAEEEKAVLMWEVQNCRKALDATLGVKP